MSGKDLKEYLYPEDLTGKNPANKVTGEKKTLNPPGWPFDFHYVIAAAGPYFRDSMEVIHNGRRLVRGTDWFPGHYFKSASESLEGTGGGLYLSVLFADRTLSGSVELRSYQTIGGKWTLSEQQILEILTNKTTDPREGTYEEVSGKPDIFPPKAHQHPSGDMTGYREVIAANYDISAAIREQTNSLPGILNLSLKAYYTGAEVDKLIIELTKSLIDGIVSDEFEKMLTEIVAQSMGNFYTKEEVDDIVKNVLKNFDKYYTKVDIDNILGDYATTQAVDNKLKTFVTLDQLAESLSQSGSITGTEVNLLLDPIKTELNKLRDDLTKIDDTVAQILVDLKKYLLIEDFDKYLPSTDKLISEATTATVVDSTIVNHTLVDYTVDNVGGYITGISLAIGSGQKCQLNLPAGRNKVSKRLELEIPPMTLELMGDKWHLYNVKHLAIRLRVDGDSKFELYVQGIDELNDVNSGISQSPIGIPNNSFGGNFGSTHCDLFIGAVSTEIFEEEDDDGNIDRDVLINHTVLSLQNPSLKSIQLSESFNLSDLDGVREIKLFATLDSGIASTLILDSIVCSSDKLGSIDIIDGYTTVVIDGVSLELTIYLKDVYYHEDPQSSGDDVDSLEISANFKYITI